MPELNKYFRRQYCSCDQTENEMGGVYMVLVVKPEG